MGTEIEPMKDFQEKLSERIRGDIGNLIPDAVLSKIVQQSLEDAFTKERITKQSKYPYNETIEAPWIVEFLQDIMKETMKEEVQKWVKENQNFIKKFISEEIFKEPEKIILNVITNLFMTRDMDIQYKIEQNIRNNLSL